MLEAGGLLTHIVGDVFGIAWEQHGETVVWVAAVLAALTAIYRTAVKPLRDTYKKAKRVIDYIVTDLMPAEDGDTKPRLAGQVAELVDSVAELKVGLADVKDTQRVDTDVIRDMSIRLRAVEGKLREAS